MSDGRATAGGAVAAALASAASWLCCLPFALGALGAVGAGVARVLGPVQPWVSALSVALLAFAFFQAYRRPTGDCAADGRCALPARVRRTRQFLWIAALASLLLTTIPYWLNWVIYWTL
jgi:mercuric ion transport protein